MKKPKKPKKTASLATWQRYKDRIKEYNKKMAFVKQAEKEANKF